MWMHTLCRHARQWLGRNLQRFWISNLVQDYLVRARRTTVSDQDIELNKFANCPEIFNQESKELDMKRVKQLSNYRTNNRD